MESIGKKPNSRSKTSRSVTSGLSAEKELRKTDIHLIRGQPRIGRVPQVLLFLGFRLGALLPGLWRPAPVLCEERGFSKRSAMSADNSYIMSLVPIIGAVVTFVVFFLIMCACIRNIDQRRTKAVQDDWWEDEENEAEPRFGEPSS